MPKRIKVENHLSVEELGFRFKHCADSVEKGHWHVVWLIARGKLTEEVSDMLGISAHWVRQIVKRYNTQGPDSMKDQRHENQGREELLNSTQLQQLQEALQQPPPDGGLWSGPKVAAWMSQVLGHEVWPQRGWEYLKKNRLSIHTPQTTACQSKRRRTKNVQRRNASPICGKSLSRAS